MDAAVAKAGALVGETVADHDSMVHFVLPEPMVPRKTRRGSSGNDAIAIVNGVWRTVDYLNADSGSPS
jgi:hypothetical protein